MTIAIDTRVVLRLVRYAFMLCGMGCHGGRFIVGGRADVGSK